MDSRCETIGKYVLPVFRALVAKELVTTHHLTQSDAAKKIGTTQAAISQYVTSKRAIRGSEQFTPILPKIQVMASDAANRLIKNQVSWGEVTLNFCTVCSTLFIEKDQTGDNYTI
jgi:predicted transcriptional regulator